MKSYRILKIHPKHRTRRWDIITIPEIRLEGKWLEEADFQEGNYVQVKVERGKLTISLRS